MIDATGVPETLLVLGAGSAIAQSVTARLVERGTATLLLAVRHPDELAPWLDDLHRAHPELTVCVAPFDAVDVAAHPRFVDVMWEGARRIDMVLVAFGVMGDPLADDRRCDDLAVAGTNFLGALSILRLVAPRLVAQGQGRIVVLSSAAALLPRGEQAAYASSKAGLDAFAQGLSLDLEGTGVEVTIVRPGFVHSPMTAGMKPAPLATTPESVANDIVRGLEIGARVVWSPPLARAMTGVARRLPRTLYRRLWSSSQTPTVVKKASGSSNQGM
ncbi:MAG TPA: SDR family NAD(P)-dependent oxidoreductase [Acidimicrobiales bacterium]|nr:SDR family NAD(P)-dependent oxidoreductase [Acidimicrobiales bacterium]